MDPRYRPGQLGQQSQAGGSVRSSEALPTSSTGRGMPGQYSEHAYATASPYQPAPGHAPYAQPPIGYHEGSHGYGQAGSGAMGAYASYSGPASSGGSARGPPPAYNMPVGAMPAYPGPGGPAGYGPPGPGAGGMPSLNPWSMLTSVSQMGQNVQASQHFVSSRVSWYTGGFFGSLFQVDSKYMQRKLTLLLAPYLRGYQYLRRDVATGGAGATALAAPRDDVYAPDLYIPLMALLTYVVLSATTRALNGSFAPDVVYSMFSWAVAAWGVSFTVTWGLVHLMGLVTAPPALELLAYAGYAFVGYCVAILAGWATGGRAGWYSAWLYSSACASVFFVRTFKQIIRVDAARRGHAASRRVWYLLLILCGSQFLVSWVMGAPVHGHSSARGTGQAQVTPA